MKRILILVKLLTVAAFMVTLSATYYLRSEILELNRLRFESQNVRTEDAREQRKQSFPLRMKEYEARMANHVIEMEHYESMLELYRTDYDAYVKRLKDNYRPPQMPNRPKQPDSPELSDRLADISAAFSDRQLHYFEKSRRLNGVTCASALLLTGGLLFLIFFEEGREKLFYVIVLVVSFVFMIGPSFHSLMSALAGLLHAPPFQ